MLTLPSQPVGNFLLYLQCTFIVRSRNKFLETNLTKMGDLRTPRLNMRDQKLKNGRFQET